VITNPAIRDNPVEWTVLFLLLRNELQIKVKKKIFLIEPQMGFYPVEVVLQYNTTQHINIHITQNNTQRSDKTQHTKIKTP
jgi:hypothetical protein